MCAVATEPNAIPVSPRWAEKLIHKEQGAPADDQRLSACRKLSAERPTAAQAPAGNGEEKRNTGNSRDVNVGVPVEDRQSVTNVELPPWWRALVANEGSKVEGILCNVCAPAVLPVEVVGRSSNGSQLRIDRTVERLTSDKLRTYLDGRWCELPLVRTHMAKRTEDDNQVGPKRTPAEQAIPEEQQGALCCAVISHANTQAEEALPTPAVDIPHATDDEDSLWPTAKLEFTLFDESMQSPDSQDLPQEIREVLQTHRHVFHDSLPPGLPPKRPHDHRVLLPPGKLPTKSALYRMTPDQLRFHNQAMTPVQQKYSIYDQELLVLVTALDKWSHLLRAAKCRASNSLNQKPAGLLQQLTSRRWSHVSLDFITDLPLTTTGHDSVLVLVDSLSKMAHFVPAKKTFTAANTVDALADRRIRYHGLPEVLISDCDPRFQSDLWQQLCARFNTKRALSSSFHPQSDGQTERVNGKLEQMLRTYIQSDEREWERLLPALELAYNTTNHSSTEISPFEVMIGEKPLTAVDLDVIGALSPTLTPPMTKLFRQLCDRAQRHILQAKCQQKHYADTRRRVVEYALVPDSPRAPAQEPQEAVVEWPPTRDAAGNPTDQYEVDYIMDQRGSGDEACYLVKWRGFPEDQATWEPASHLEGCPALLRAWRRRQRNRGRP
ncbi:Similar to Transposon MAGGYgagandpolgenehomologues, related [Eimeria praecox]|uniref:Similar to Transposon MAGGYgagandpolgenehomologues, related n=1 Tax=Eimeria praecox TaxID=51316 RepID=U6H381_9EIME|nr:Similar to Transposon MAGGYgagandpolgenehomologues, related [Eimeria praecox]